MLRDDWAEETFTFLSCALEQLGDSQDGNPDHPELSPAPTPPVSCTTMWDDEGYVARFRAWGDRQGNALKPLFRAQRANSQLAQATWDEIERKTPELGALVFLSVLDIVEVGVDGLQGARFRLNKFGRSLASALWQRAPAKLPLSLFFDCSWLHDQVGACKNLPVLGLAHVLTIVFMSYSSNAQLSSTTQRDEMIDESIQMLLTAIRINGKPVRASDATTLLISLKDDAPAVELTFQSSGWAYHMDLAQLVDMMNEVAKAQSRCRSHSATA